ncbi:DUF3999 family protein [Paludisphaera sp.]|uniref:DUF3999 family protein n=1 Tax=Paludisphaera sp. TaxID=2017432 RepID=UPI00301DD14F
MTAARLVLSTLLVSAAASAPAQTTFKYRRDILRDDPTEAVTVVPLDAPVYAGTRDGLPDVRLRDDRGEEVPFAIRVQTKGRSVLVREPVASRVESLKVIEGEALEVVTVLEDDAPEPDGAAIQTPLVDFERRVRVLGSLDGETWTPLAEGRILDYSRFMDMRDVDVAFPARGFRMFKFVIEHESDEQRSPYYQLSRARDGDEERRAETETILRRPFRVDRVALHRAVRGVEGEEPTTTRAALAVERVEVDPRERVTRIEVAAGRLPLTRLSLRATSRNFHRPARVLRPTDAGWVDVGRGTLSLYQLGDFRREELTLDFPETRADRLRIEIEDGDSPPLEVVGVDGDSVDRRVEFVAAAGRSYRLEYGSDAADAPRHDADAVLAALGPGAPQEVATLGPVVANPDYRPSPRRAVALGGAWMLLAVVVMTVVLAWAILQAVRRADKAPTDGWG